MASHGAFRTRQWANFHTDREAFESRNLLARSSPVSLTMKAPDPDNATRAVSCLIESEGIPESVLF